MKWSERWSRSAAAISTRGCHEDAWKWRRTILGMQEAPQARETDLLRPPPASQCDGHLSGMGEQGLPALIHRWITNTDLCGLRCLCHLMLEAPLTLRTASLLLLAPGRTASARPLGGVAVSARSNGDAVGVVRLVVAARVLEAASVVGVRLGTQLGRGNEGIGRRKIG